MILDIHATSDTVWILQNMPCAPAVSLATGKARRSLSSRHTVVTGRLTCSENSYFRLLVLGLFFCGVAWVSGRQTTWLLVEEGRPSGSVWGGRVQTRPLSPP